MTRVSSSTIAQFVRYNLVGIANTLVGFSIIFGLMFLGIDPMVSNAIGYGVGGLLSFYLNKKYTFQSTGNATKQALYFFMVLGVSYLLNFMTLQFLLPRTDAYIAQLISAVVYTLSSFILAKRVVFKVAT